MEEDQDFEVKKDGQMLFQRMLHQYFHVLRLLDNITLDNVDNKYSQNNILEDQINQLEDQVDPDNKHVDNVQNQHFEISHATQQQRQETDSAIRLSEKYHLISHSHCLSL